MDFTKIVELDDEIKLMVAHMEELRGVFGEDHYKAVEYFDDAIRFPVEDILKLNTLVDLINQESDADRRSERIEEFKKLRDTIKPLTDAKERIYLWEEGKMPKHTEYTNNENYQYNHAPDYRPYMFELLVSDDVTPKGAVILCAGGDHAESNVHEGYEVGKQLNEKGYQCFLLNNRVNGNPWSKQECGVDVARAIRILRKNAVKYRIPSNRIAYAGFSNGGLTGEANIQYFSGNQTVTDSFPEYEVDELDEYYGAPDAFLNIYGARMNFDTFDYTKAVYPPTFLAMGRDDFGITNFNAVIPDLIAHEVPLEIHSFAATPHGVAGKAIVDGEVKYPGFELWVPLADYFMQDVYAKQDK